MDFAVSGRNSTENENNALIEKLEQLLEYLKTTSKRGETIVINLNDREVMRVLREMGVVLE